MNISELLVENSIFHGFTPSEMEALLKEYPPLVKSYKRGDTVYSKELPSPLVGFVLLGRCEVTLDKGNGGRTLMNILRPADSFGILSVFSAEEFPTKITASIGCDVAFFTDVQIKSMMKKYPLVSENVISFLIGRINFLNKRIYTYSSGSAEKKLAVYLLNQSEFYGGDTLPFNHLKCGEELGVGRASVYRAIASLTERGLIKAESKKIIITDKLGLERILQ